MAKDFKILDDTRGVLRYDTWPNPYVTSGEYALIQRLIKNLLTTRGEDQFDPAWGSSLAQNMQGIPGQHVGEARRAASASLTQCYRDLSSSQPDDPAGRIVGLRLDDVSYDEVSTSWVLSVTVATEVREFTLETGL